MMIFQPPDRMDCVNSTIHEREELAKRALVLKKKELKYKLMSASQMRNRAELEEVRIEANYNKERMVKIQALANKLREKFIKAAKAAKTAEILHKKLEQRMFKLEKFVADEQMQLTKLAIDCKGIGSDIYGPEYKLNSVVNLRVAREKERQLLAVKIRAAKKALRVKPRLRPQRLSSIADLKDSYLLNFASYRLTSNFCETDLIGSCSDKSCPYQHKSNYLMNDIEKLADILSYKPSLTGFKPDPDLSKDANDNRCRLNLKLYAAKLLSKNPNKSIEVIAQTLVKYVRSNRSNYELLVTTRVLPKSVHLVSSDKQKSPDANTNENKE